MLVKLMDHLVDFSPFKMKIKTSIPMSKLVHVICNFYWDKGHKSIQIIEDPNDFETYTDYNPDLKLENADKIKKI